MSCIEFRVSGYLLNCVIFSRKWPSYLWRRRVSGVKTECSVVLLVLCIVRRRHERLWSPHGQFSNKSVRRTPWSRLRTELRLRVLLIACYRRHHSTTAWYCGVRPVSRIIPFLVDHLIATYLAQTGSVFLSCHRLSACCKNVAIVAWAFQLAWADVRHLHKSWILGTDYMGIYAFYFVLFFIFLQ